MDNDANEKEVFLASKGFKFHSTEEVWRSSAGELSRNFVDDNSLTEIKRQLSKAEKTAEFRKEPFKLYNH